MTKLVAFPIGNNERIVVEVGDEYAGNEPRKLLADGGEVLRIASTTFERAVSKLGPIASAVLDQVKDLGPQEVKVEMGIKFSADVGIILAKTSGEGSCKVTLSWKKDPSI